MAEYQVLYWQEIPSQVRAKEGEDEVKLQLAARLQEKIDAVAAERGLTGMDDYLEQWCWGDAEQRAGSAQEVAQALKEELEAKFPA